MNKKTVHGLNNMFDCDSGSIHIVETETDSENLIEYTFNNKPRHMYIYIFFVRWVLFIVLRKTILL